MNRNQIWRMVACSTDTYNRHEEIHVFVDAPDYETAKKRIYERLAEEWDLPQEFIDIYNLWSGSELQEMSTGGQIPEGLPLLESGGGNGIVYYDREPLILVASAQLREVLENALQAVLLMEQQEQQDCGDKFVVGTKPD
ncbi:hypothetical protein PT300_04490 [Enterobacteriaceae bacterium ESL0689]|nr:hypothetical protein [Enterobacteriaceae bacterium ESL0689]